MNKRTFYYIFLKCVLQCFSNRIPYTAFAALCLRLDIFNMASYTKDYSFPAPLPCPLWRRHDRVQCSNAAYPGFLESVSPKPLSIILGPFKFSDILEDQGAPPVSLTPVTNVKNTVFKQKSFNILFGHLWVVK